MNSQRITAGILALSGAVFALITWMIPLFWPGYLVWFGWIWIACGSEKISKRWFWLMSAMWNAGLLWLFLGDTDWSGNDKALIYWHTRFHLLFATFASAFLCFRFQSTIALKKNEPNKSPQTTRAFGPRV